MTRGKQSQESPAIRITETTPGVVVDDSILTGSGVVTICAALPIEVRGVQDLAEDGDWWGVLSATERSSLGFLRDEPDLYDDSDGEPV